jgi:predicted RNA-binding protein with RPS1 domain
LTKKTNVSEGLVHVSEISGDKRGNPMSRFQVDDVIQAKVLNVSREEKKIGLSIRKLEEGSEKEILQNYLNTKEEATSSLGDLLRQEMMNLQQQMSSDDPGSEAVQVVETNQDNLDEIGDHASEEAPGETSGAAPQESQAIETAEAESESVNHVNPV